MLAITALSLLRRAFGMLGFLKSLGGGICRFCKFWMSLITCVCSLTASIWAVTGKLSTNPSLTISCTTNVPDRSGTKEALWFVALEITAWLPIGAEVRDQL